MQKNSSSPECFQLALLTARKATIDFQAAENDFQIIKKKQWQSNFQSLDYQDFG